MRKILIGIIGLFFLSTITHAEDFRESLVSGSVILKREFKVDIDECARLNGGKVRGCGVEFFPLDPIEAEINPPSNIKTPITIRIPVHGYRCKENDAILASFYTSLNGYECNTITDLVSRSCNFEPKSDEFYFREAALRLPDQKLTRYVISYKKK